ncbi:MAG: hypothetical protein ACPGEC_02920, partial [Flavobacteriales bacterium]
MKLNTDIKILFLGLLLILVKLFFAEIDLPDFDLAYYSTIDELYYTEFSFDFSEYGKLHPNEKVNTFTFSLILNAVTYFTIELFGDNFIGLRLSSIIFSMAALALFWNILRQLIKDVYVKFFAILFLGLNLNYTYASLVVEPTISRLFSMLLIINIVLYVRKKNIPLTMLNSFIITLPIAILIYFSYPSNIFTYLGLFFSLCFLQLEKTKQINLKTITTLLLKNGSIFILSALTTLTLTYLFFKHFYNIDTLESTSLLSKGYSNRVGYNFKIFARNIFNITRANLFIINPLLLCSFLISLVYLGFNRKKMDSKLIVCLLFFFAFILQTIAVNDFPGRKLIIIIPFVILVVAFAIDNSSLLSYKTKPTKLIKFSIVLALIVPVLSNYIYFRGYNLWDHVGLLIFGVSALYLGFIFLKHQALSKNSILFLVACLFLPEIILSQNYLISEQRFNYKNTMESLSKYDGQNFYGGFSKGFRMYNEIKTSVNPYLYYGKKDQYYNKIDSLAKSNQPIDYIIDYGLTDSENKQEIYEKIG